MSLKLFYFYKILITFLDPCEAPIFFYDALAGALTFFIENFSGYSGYFSKGGSFILFLEACRSAESWSCLRSCFKSPTSRLINF